MLACYCYIAIDALDRAVIFTALEKITFSNYESRVETSLSLSLSFSFKYMQNLIGIINQLRKLLGSTAFEFRDGARLAFIAVLTKNQ